MDSSRQCLPAGSFRAGVLRPKPEQGLTDSGIKEDKTAGVIAQIWAREARTGVQNLIGLMTVISI